MGGRVVLHSDLNNCYASIECMLHPELRGKYIAVCGSTEDRHGIVLAKNQLAKPVSYTHLASTTVAPSSRTKSIKTPGQSSAQSLLSCLA